jgi:dihydrofolate reductase
MRKIVAALNQTFDGFCDHTAGLPDEEIHDHYTGLINGADTILYGRTTFELMKYWQDVIKNPSDEKSMNDFAKAIDKIEKIVFSRSIKNTNALGWGSATLSDQSLEEKVLQLKQQTGTDVLVGSRSLIVQLTNLNLIDEYQLCVYPVIIGKGLPLFDQIKDRTIFKLLKTKMFKSGAILYYYQRA